MSTSNSETLKLYKNDKLYNGSRYMVYLRNRTMESFLGTPDYNKTVYYKSISEPITIDESIKYCDEYTYGSITNDDKTYYFFVDSISTDAFKQTTINYTIDWWATNWAKINCTKAHVTRKPTRPDYMIQPISDLNMNISQQNLTNDFVIAATYIPSGEGIKRSFISYVILEGSVFNVNNVELGSWLDRLALPTADIKDSFVVPLYSYSDFETDITIYAVNSAMYQVSPPDVYQALDSALQANFALPFPQDGDIIFDTSSGKYYKYTPNAATVHFIETTYQFSNMLARYITRSNILGQPNSEFKMYMVTDTTPTSRLLTKPISGTFVSTETNRQGIMDWNGNSVWEAPIGLSSMSFTTRLLFGLSHIMIEFLPTDNQNNSEMLSGRSFCYDCRHVGLFVDSYKDYVMKNRDYDVNMRQIQSSKQELQAWASTAENIGFGMAFGQGKGAIAAGVGGVLEAVFTTALNRTFDPQIQTQYDLRYARMTDQISIIGDSITDVLFALDTNQGLLKKYELSVTTESEERYYDDVTTNGYYCDEVTDNLELYFSRGSVVQADSVVVEGACNLEGKRQVVQRLMNGVEFI